MDRLIPWGKKAEENRPCLLKGTRGNKPYRGELMLRLYVLPSLYTLSSEFRQPGTGWRHAGAVSGPAEPQWGIQEKLLAQVSMLLEEQGPKKGTIVDSDQISAPSNAKNAEKKRDPQAHSTKNEKWKGFVMEAIASPSQPKNDSARSKVQIKRRGRKDLCQSQSRAHLRYVKGGFYCRKPRYRGLRKKASKPNFVFALTNLILTGSPDLAG